MKVTAAVLHNYKEDLKIEEVNLRDIQPGEVLVKLKASGICHSDLSVKQGALLFPTPIILGHEGAGEVVQVGEGVTSVVVGSKVILNNVPECGKCKQCKTPFSNLCVATGLGEQKGENMFSDNSFKTPFTLSDGKPAVGVIGPVTFATHCIVPECWVTPFFSDISFEEAALIGCGVMTGIGCTKYATQVTPGSSVLVFGMGSIGLNAVQGAKIAGASHVIAVDINPKKESAATEFGATHFVNPRAFKEGESLSTLIKTITGSNFVDFAIEATGIATVLESAVPLVHPFWGVCIAVGIPPFTSEFKFPSPTFLIGRTLKGVYFGNSKPISAGKDILELHAQKKLKIAPLITHRLALSEINKGFDLLEKGEAIRAVIVYD